MGQSAFAVVGIDLSLMENVFHEALLPEDLMIELTAPW
jgi:hypothetical protein